MKNNKILELIDSYWKFDNDQCPTSTWHDKQDLLEAIENELYSQLAVIRNKMSPIKNLIALFDLEESSVEMANSDTIYKLRASEIEKAKQIIKEICQQ